MRTRTGNSNYDSDTNSYLNRSTLQERHMSFPEDAVYIEAASEAPSSPGWRESRLRNIGSSNSNLRVLSSPADETQPFVTSPLRSYGAIRTNSINGVIPSLSRQNPRSSSVNSWIFSSSSIAPGERRPSLFGTLRRRPSAYDSPLAKRFADGDDHTAEKINGVRVWYSSFQSIDWLHDAVHFLSSLRCNTLILLQIKDISRLRRLRRRKSWRGRLVILLDRFSGWFIVSAIGFLSALVAFLIVRSESWLFDLKEGHCIQGWWKSRSQCCSYEESRSFLPKDSCNSWQTWDQMFHLDDRDPWHIHWAMEYLSYIVMAVGDSARTRVDLLIAIS